MRAQLFVAAVTLTLAPVAHADSFGPNQSTVANPAIVAPNAVWPMFDSRERLSRAGAYYVFGTGNAGDFTKGGLSVAAGQYLNVRTCNTGTKTAYVTKRIFDFNATTPIAYGGVSAPAALAGTQVSATAAVSTSGSNIIVGNAASPTVTMTYSVGTGHVDNAAGTAVPTGNGYLYPNDKNELTELRILPPGLCFGQYINVPTGLGSGPYFLGFRMYEYEE